MANKKESAFSLKNLTKTKAPSLPYREIAKYILGGEYNLSLAFVGEKRIKDLNTKFRKKEKVTDILSFSLSKKTGEIIICLKKARKDSPLFEHSYRQHVGFLFIHGILHLKGMAHSSRMESKERQAMKKFSLI